MAAVNAIEPGLRRELLNNVLICGGTTKAEGFVPRLKSEVEKLAGQSIKVSTFENAALEGAYSFSLTDKAAAEAQMTRAEYEEFGPGYIHEKQQYDI